MYYRTRRSTGRGCSPSMGRILIGLVIAAFSLISYFGTQSENEVTGEVQHVDITPDQEIAMGIQAAPEMAEQFGGLDPDGQAQQIIDEVGQGIVQSSAARRTPYEFEFHLLADNQTVNAFALPGGQIFITRALFDRLSREGELAGGELRSRLGLGEPRQHERDARQRLPAVQRQRIGQRKRLAGRGEDCCHEVARDLG